ncbi:hypothetical protein Tco_0514259 [Tanacetum coccineum]
MKLLNMKFPSIVDAKRPSEDMCGSYRVMWKGYGMSKECYGARWRFGNEQMIKVVFSGWSFVYAILGQMTYPVASSTLDSAGSYVMQGAPFTQGTIPSIPIGGSISLEGFLPSILLLVVIIVMVVVIIVIMIVVVVDDVSLILKLSFVIIGVPVGPVFLLGLLALAIVAACAFRAEEMTSVISCWMAAKVMAGVSDVDVFLGGILST